MGPEHETRRTKDSGNNDFDGRDLLVGRPEEGKGRPAAGAANSPPDPIPPHPDAHQPDANDDAIAEILETVRATAARIDALQDSSAPAPETAKELARETAALTQAVADARGALGKAAELAARKDGAVETARALAGTAATLKTQGEALDKRLHATGYQSEMAAETTAELKKVATSLESNLRIHATNMFRINQDRRWRPLLIGLAIGAASFVFFALGLVLQRETDFVSFGDPRDAWNQHVVEHFAPLLAPCASMARMKDKPIECRLTIRPTREVTIPVYPKANLISAPPEERGDPAAEG